MCQCFVISCKSGLPVNQVGVIEPLTLVCWLHHIVLLVEKWDNPGENCITAQCIKINGSCRSFLSSRISLYYCHHSFVLWPYDSSSSCCSVLLWFWQPSALQVQLASELAWPWMASHLIYLDLGVFFLTHEDQWPQHFGLIKCPYKCF